MVTRLSQKAVEDMFYDDCINAGVPCTRKHTAKQGYLHMQYSYGGMQVQYNYQCGGSSNITSGFIGARDMYNQLKYFNPKTTYKEYRARDIRMCKSKKERK